MLNYDYFKDDPLVHMLNDIKKIYEMQNFKKFVWVGKNWWINENGTPFSYIDVKVDAILDNDSKKWNELTAVPIKPLSCVQELGPDTIYVISNYHSTELLNQLVDLDIPSEKIFTIPHFNSYIVNQKLEIERKIFSDYRQLSIKELQNIELDILVEFRNKCNEWGLNYFLAGGTLLGAIRHKGFIPWDDDIDVYMPYEDYLKFIDLYEDNDDYVLLDWRKNNDYDFQFVKFANKNTIVFHERGINMGVYIDIFPIAGYPETQKEIESKWEENARLDVEWDRYFVRKSMGLNCEDCRQKIMDYKYERSFYDSTMVGTMQVFYGKKPWVSPKTDFSQSIEKSFEGEKFLVPIGYDSHLSYRYGDYMKLPPKEEQVVHGYTPYIKR